ncbi:MAG: peptidase M14, partial [Gemmatimonadetes bacterium]|nr:peptidase M14 [Gemmatimonadota bacterium]
MFRHFSSEPSGHVEFPGRAAGRRRARGILAGLAIVAFAGFASAQETGDARAVRLPPDPPEVHLGFRPGEDRRVVDWSQTTAYLEVLAAQSDRVRLDTIGRSTLDRPMVLLTITDPANHARLEGFRATQAQLADPRRIDGPGLREELIRSGRLVVLVTSAIHPTEVGGSLVPLNLAYRLAAATDSALLKVLRECVVLIVPSVNPDGVDMVAEWYRESIGMPWEGSPPPRLYHHYTGHDNNRDWYSFTQVETRNVVERVYNVWHPQIVHDIHQQGPYGSRYFVPPWTNPIEPNVDPLLTAATNSLGTAIAWKLLRQGKKGVAVNAGYDAWSPARAYAHYHGGVRILSETASARLATPIEVLPGELQSADRDGPGDLTWNHPAPWPGGSWSLADILEYMEAGAIALLQSAATSREAWLENFVSVGERAVEGWTAWPRAWVVPAHQGNESGIAELTRILRTAQVEIDISTSDLTAGKSTWPAGSLVIDMRQPYGAFVQMLLAPQAYPGGLEYPGGPPKAPYDVTAHNLPLLLGVQAE